MVKKEITTEKKMEILIRRLFKFINESTSKNLIEYNYFDIENKKRYIYKIYKTENQIIINRENK